MQEFAPAYLRFFPCYRTLKKLCIITLVEKQRDIENKFKRIRRFSSDEKPAGIYTYRASGGNQRNRGVNGNSAACPRQGKRVSPLNCSNTKTAEGAVNALGGLADKALN